MRVVALAWEAPGKGGAPWKPGAGRCDVGADSSAAEAPLAGGAESGGHLPEEEEEEEEEEEASRLTKPAGPGMGVRFRVDFFKRAFG